MKLVLVNLLLSVVDVFSSIYSFSYPNNNGLYDIIHYSKDKYTIISEPIYPNDLAKNIVQYTYINNRIYTIDRTSRLHSMSLLNYDYFNVELEKPIYDHITHKTGRAKIIKGYNFLVAKSNSKKLYKASKNKHLIEIDFKSAEPNLYYSLKFNKSCKDIYSLFNIKKERKKIKIAVISCLYGGKVSSIKRNTGLTESEIKNKVVLYTL